MQVCVHACLCTHVYVDACVCVCAWVCGCVCVCMCVFGGENKDRVVNEEGGGERSEYRVGRAFVCFTPGATRCPKGWV